MVSVSGRLVNIRGPNLNCLQFTRPVCLIKSTYPPRFFSTKDVQGTYQSLSPSSEILDAGMDPYSYTSGRLVHQDAIQHAARHIYFDLPALSQKAVIACPGANSVIECQKIEGGFNRSFILTMDNETKLVVRLPTRIAGPPRLVTRSEVATMNFGVLEFCLEPSNDTNSTPQCQKIPRYRSLKSLTGMMTL